MRNGTRTLVAGMLILFLVPAVSHVMAGLDVDLVLRADLGDDELFMAISSRYCERDRSTVADFGVYFRDPDDFAVSVFLASRSGRGAAEISGLRERGYTWWQIGLRLGVPMDSYFVPVTHDPGPPYGKAYGHWKKRGRQSRSPGLLTDADIRNLVAVRMLHDYYGLSVEQAMARRASGTDIRTLLTVEYRERHRKASRSPSSGKGHGKSGAKSKGKVKKK